MNAVAGIVNRIFRRGEVEKEGGGEGRGGGGATYMSSL